MSFYLLFFWARRYYVVYCLIKFLEKSALAICLCVQNCCYIYYYYYYYYYLILLLFYDLSVCVTMLHVCVFYFFTYSWSLHAWFYVVGPTR